MCWIKIMSGNITVQRKNEDRITNEYIILGQRSGPQPFLHHKKMLEKVPFQQNMGKTVTLERKRKEKTFPYATL